MDTIEYSLKILRGGIRTSTEGQLQENMQTALDALVRELAAQPPATGEPDEALKNAHMMIVRLCRVARVAGRHDVSEQAISLIRRQGYNPSPLRKGERLIQSDQQQEGEKG